MKFYLTIVLIFFLPLFGRSQQFPSDLWHIGKLVLVSEDTLKGDIKYNLGKDIVQVEVNKKIFTYSAQNIFYFEIYDETSESYREFYVLPYGLVTSYKTPVIFEVLIKGNITLLSREYIGVKNIQNPYSYGSYPQEVLLYNYYFLDIEGTITKYSMKKNDLFLAVAKKQNQVMEYMRANKLHHDKRNDLVRIIAFYNALL